MSKSKIFLLVSLVFLSINLLWLLCFDNQVKNPDFVFDKFYTFEARVKTLDKKLNGWNLIVKPNDLENFSGQILVYAPLYPEYHQGDILELACKIYRPEPIEDETGKVFLYNKYLAKDKIYATCFRPRIKIIGQNKSLDFYIFQARDYFWNNLNVYLREPASSLAKAMLLATRREIPDAVRNSFAKLGLSHVVAISGLHMAIIVWLLQSFLLSLGLSRQKAFLFLLGLLTFYLYLIGFPSSALRASIMVIMTMLGPFLGRSTISVYSLLLAADIFVIVNPYVLLYDIGFQLSFMAVLGLLFYVRFFNKVLIFIPEKFKLREALSVTLAAQVFTWPLIIYYFGIFSLIAPLANFLVLPLLPAVLILSLILALGGSIPMAAQLLAWPLFIILKIIVELTEYLARIPYAYFEVQGFDLSYMILALFFMFVLTIVIKPQEYD